MSGSPQLDDLMGAFHVTDDDLVANVQGRLGANQARRLQRGVWQNLVLGLILFGGFVAIVLGVAVHPIAWWRWLLIGAVAAALLATSYVAMRNLRRAIADGTVQHYRGPVTIALVGRAGLRMSVAGVSFQLPVRRGHLVNGASYDVYVAPRSKTVVAMVPLV